ncbi:hypothetical protein EVG20_g9811 [Dentipellis fragilis]|uniref:Uncharacterized protein n=1 Tax=Dentipellis fragilis TaxID=205917 RepID=A0A4Y9XYG5_9AGAM|nr:hypothetical protein EVG20_g9811 [Dentipellis fragilis]
MSARRDGCVSYLKQEIVLEFRRHTIRGCGSKRKRNAEVLVLRAAVACVWATSLMREDSGQDVTAVKEIEAYAGADVETGNDNTRKLPRGGLQSSEIPVVHRSFAHLCVYYEIATSRRPQTKGNYDFEKGISVNASKCMNYEDNLDATPCTASTTPSASATRPTPPSHNLQRPHRRAPHLTPSAQRVGAGMVVGIGTSRIAGKKLDDEIPIPGVVQAHVTLPTRILPTGLESSGSSMSVLCEQFMSQLDDAHAAGPPRTFLRSERNVAEVSFAAVSRDSVLFEKRGEQSYATRGVERACGARVASPALLRIAHPAAHTTSEDVQLLKSIEGV